MGVLHVLLVFVGMSIVSIPVTGYEAPQTTLSRASRNTQHIVAPILSDENLETIQDFDKMLCFPKILCSLTTTGTFHRPETLNLDNLAEGYINLLTAFPGGPMSLFTRSENPDDDYDDENVSYAKDDDSSSEESYPIGKSEGDDDEEAKESKEMLLEDPLYHQKEKLKIHKLMQELIEEEKSDQDPSSSSMTEKLLALPVQVPFKLGLSMLKHMVVPYLLGERRRRGILINYPQLNHPRVPSKAGATIGKAVRLWSRLKNPNHCEKLYPKCPFAAWETVALIKIINDAAN